MTQLNSPQETAVHHVHGPLLILAGAGSGKTRVLTHRMAYLLSQKQAKANEVLCVTFTNKAAKEMEHRIYQLLNDMNVPLWEPLWISTFHSFCVKILRQYEERLGYKKNFGICDSSEALGQIKKIILLRNISDTIYPPKKVLNRISHVKMLGLSTEDLFSNSPRSSSILDSTEIEIFKDYQAELKKANVMDFDDLLLNTYLLLKKNSDVLQILENQFKFIMIDEYQDTNRLQYLLVKMLAKKHRNLCVVGDEDQSIYSWRGADISNILSFEDDFPEAITVKLEENYRSSAAIVEAASTLIQNNSQRKNKKLFTSNSKGELISVREERNEYDEARFVVKTITERLQRGFGTYNDYAVFYRTNAQSRVLEDQLRSAQIPYRLIGGMRFYERMEIKDILCYMKLTLNQNDDLSLKRVINVPARGIGKTTVEKLEAFAFEKKLSLFEAIPICIQERLFNSGTTSKLRNFFELLQTLKPASINKNLVDFYDFVLEQTKYVETLKTENTIEAQSRIDNLKEFYNALTQFMLEKKNIESSELLTLFLEQMALVSDVDQLDSSLNAITLMTLHISKGLEFPYVFIVGLEENLFPNAGNEDEEDLDDLEEERRLAYVGMTRAREKLWLTYAKGRKVWGQDQFNPPSRFINELPENLLEKSSSLGNDGFAQRLWMSQKQKTDYGFEKQSFPEDEGPTFSESEPGTKVLKKGCRVRHATFGVGSVFSVEGSGEQQKVSVVFADHSVKKFITKYAKLDII